MQKMIEVETHSAEDTKALGSAIGSRLKGGEVIELMSDLGGGKTTFVQGLASGAGSRDHVSSPTFTVSKLYKAPKFEIHHFDFYRLADAGLMEHELHDLLLDAGVVLVVEWAAVVQHILPDERLRIVLKKTAENGRQLRIQFHETLAYLVEDL